MSNIPNVESWKWFHFFYAIGTPLAVGAFFLDASPLIGDLFWIPFGFALATFGGFGQLASKRRPYKKDGVRGWETQIKPTKFSLVLLGFSLISFGIATYAVFQHIA
ncbi:hypothetical protein QO227_20895 [Vibrio vulnificus]|uniref:hypothetical protein n=1 Tax=Vibrio vulnificus TaxID=672 RepID=UPI0024DFF047|nr:hypothetical protein [Vibrio vulnificus]MDK2604921.1 hypothetical protein [Vibrio vulnificus]MDK2626971.1 hypothetical protein [Vibrio vulnificus]MDK2644507.1 hypothetical protein [Vibrio vulnificus]MDK2670475.1 hypothetical protein [Vibrio vulnificus]MDK2721497.1 hypothetical protein [Vibrio vulnificus]